MKINFFCSLSLNTLTSESIESMQYERYNYAATTMYGRIYVAGGQATPDLHLCSVECYNPVDNKWTKIANMNFPRSNFALAESKGMLYAIGHHKSVERYDPVRDVWTTVRTKFNCFNMYFSNLAIKIKLLFVHTDFSDWFI